MYEQPNFEQNPQENPEASMDTSAFGELSDPKEIRDFVKKFIEQPVPRGKYDIWQGPEKEKARELENKMAGINELRAYLKDPIWSKNRDAWEAILDEFEKELKQ